jgi:hypothetical protein
MLLSSAPMVPIASEIKHVVPSALLVSTVTALTLQMSFLALLDLTPNVVLKLAPFVPPVSLVPTLMVTVLLQFLANPVGSLLAALHPAPSALLVLSVLSVTTTLKILAPTVPSLLLVNLTAPSVPLVITAHSPPSLTLTPCLVKSVMLPKFPALPVNILLKDPSSAKIAQLVSTVLLKSLLMVDAMFALTATTLLKEPFM